MQTKQGNILIIGSGTIGSALVAHYKLHHQSNDQATDQKAKPKVFVLSRSNCDFSEKSLKERAVQLKEQGEFSIIINTIGVLHDELVSPEKSLKQLSQEKLAHYFHVNTILPALCIQHLSGLLSKDEPAVFASLSAMVGSTQDNHLGGWYGYRASKAALNSFIKTASIELKRTHKKASIIAIHPGTTVGDLSAPFAKNVRPEKYYSPELSSKRIAQVIDEVNSSQTGLFFNWDGSVLPW